MNTPLEKDQEQKNVTSAPVRSEEPLVLDKETVKDLPPARADANAVRGGCSITVPNRA